MAKHVLTIFAIMKYFKDEERLIKRGENAVESKHIKEMVFDRDLLLIRGEVHASMKEKHYKIEIDLNKDFEIQGATCTCPRGQVLCHHIAALCIFAHQNISVTDKECSWIAKKSNKQSQIHDINYYYPPKVYKCTTAPLTESDLSEFKKKLAIFDRAVGFSWLLSDEPTKVNLELVVDVESLLYSEEYMNASNKIELFQEKLKVDSDTIMKVAEATLGQSTNETWLLVRKNRLTASNFGIVIAASKRKRFPPSLFNKLTESYNLNMVKAIQWGREHEADGVEVFEATFNKKVVKAGFWLHPCGFIGASPDGFVGDDAIIEVKCPYKYRESSLFQGLKQDKGYIVTVSQDDTMMVNENHDYYHQLQGQMYITNRSLCYLTIWSPAEAYVIEVQKDENWGENIELLQKFYLQQYLLFITGAKK